MSEVLCVALEETSDDSLADCEPVLDFESSSLSEIVDVGLNETVRVPDDVPLRVPVTELELLPVSDFVTDDVELFVPIEEKEELTVTVTDNVSSRDSEAETV